MFVSFLVKKFHANRRGVGIRSISIGNTKKNARRESEEEDDDNVDGDDGGGSGFNVIFSMTSNESDSFGKRKKRRALLVGQGKKRCGNDTTASRISRILRECCDLAVTRCRTTESIEDAYRILKELKPDVVICIHAVKSWAFLDIERKKRPPTMLIFGGTDVNVYATQDKRIKRDIWRRCAACVAVVSFTSATTLSPDEADDGEKRRSHVIIPQGVRFQQPTESERLAAQNMYTRLSRNGSRKVLLLLAGLRPVKDVLYLMNAFRDVADASFVLVICGPRLDDTYASLVRKKTSNVSNIELIDGGVSHGTAISLIRLSDALVNSSRAEGSSGAMKEAMALGTPIIARDIPGNRATLEQTVEETLDDAPYRRPIGTGNFERVGCGVLYRNPRGFLDALRAIFDDVTSPSSSSSNVHDAKTTHFRRALVEHGLREIDRISRWEEREWTSLLGRDGKVWSSDAEKR